MAIYRAMTIIEGSSGLPEDVFVNTWHFTTGPGGGSRQDAEASIVGHLDDFYGGGTGANVLSNYIAGSGTEEVRYRIYDLADATPREPSIYEAGWGPAGPGDTLPEEVALCISFYKDRNLPRNRGRLYIGPISETANNDGRPSAGIRGALVQAGRRVIEASQDPSSSAAWAVYSTVDGDAKEVTQGWVDNAWDTQRRRGLAPTERQNFNAGFPPE